MLRSLLRRLARLLPPAVLRRVASWVRRGPTVSVVIVVTDDNAFFLDECLGSLGVQTRRADEVLLVVTGRDRLTRAAVDAQQRASHRVRSVRNDGDSPRRVGVEQARGDLVHLLDAGDRLRPSALEALVGALESTDAPLAVAARPAGGLGTLWTAPSVLADPELGHRLFRRSFLRGLDLPEPSPLDRWLPGVLVHRAADRFAQVELDVLEDLRRGTGVAFGGQQVLAPHAVAFADAVHTQLRALEEAGLDEAAASLRAHLVGTEVGPYLDDAERCDAEQWHALSALADGLAERAGLAAPVRVRVALWLAAQGRRGDLVAFTAERWWRDGDRFPTRVLDGALLAVAPVEVPAEALLVGESESPLRGVLRRARWEGETLALELLAHVRGLACDPSTTRAELTLASAGASVVVPVTWGQDVEANLVDPDPHQDHSRDVLHARVSPTTLGPGRWSLRLAVETDGVRRAGVVREVERRGSAGALPPRHGLWLDPDTGELVVGEPATAAPITPATVVEEVLLEDDVLVIRTAGARPATVSVTGDRGTASGEPQETGPGRHEVRVRLEHDPWGRGRAPLPTGSYRIALPLAPGLTERTPLTLSGSAYRVRVHRALDGRLLLHLRPPLRDDELGEHAQRGLQRWYASDEHRLDPGLVYFQSYLGASATDSPLAVHEALRHARPDLRTVWGVDEAASWTPPGAARVQLRSREWYAALATAGHLVVNIDVDRFFVKRPGQRVLQTYHGYPAKAMGRMAWEAKGWSRARQELVLGQTRDLWDLVMCGHPAMARHFREQFDYRGEIFGEGYPRHDALVGPGSEELRATTRRRLGIRDDQRVVLYAPTWRDDLATNHRVAPLAAAFDLAEAAMLLGDDYVVLLRGHRFHRTRPQGAGARILDVTDHPEIDELVLACDVAVLDYSSLRFDVLAAGRPTVFLVPDLDRYAGQVRGFLHDFVASAPGPLVATTSEAVAELRDLDGLRTRHGAAYDAFRTRFLGEWLDGHAAERAVAAFFGSMTPR